MYITGYYSYEMDAVNMLGLILIQFTVDTLQILRLWSSSRNDRSYQSIKRIQP